MGIDNFQRAFLGFSINKSGMNMFIRNTLNENEVEELVEVQ